MNFSHIGGNGTGDPPPELSPTHEIPISLTLLIPTGSVTTSMEVPLSINLRLQVNVTDTVTTVSVVDVSVESGSVIVNGPPPSSTPPPTPVPPPHPVYMGEKLADGYDMGVATSHGRTDWVTNMGDHICMAYPSGQEWGVVFITYGKPMPMPRPGQDLSSYSKLSLELRGETGGESMSVGIKDNQDPDDGRETKILVENLTTEWQTVTLPLVRFTTADLTSLYVMTEFVFEPGTPAETVCFRNIQYLP